MSAKIDCVFVTAEIRDSDGKWHSEDKDFEAVLNASLPFGGVPGSVPNPALYLAEIAADEFGCEVVSYDETETDEIIP